MPRLTLTPRRRRMSLTSPIDVIFLLLLSLMLSSTFTRFGDLAFLAAGPGAGPDPADPPAFLRVLPDRIMLDTTEVAPDELSAALAAIAGGLVVVAPASGIGVQRFVDVRATAQAVLGIRLRLIDG